MITLQSDAALTPDEQPRRPPWSSEGQELQLRLTRNDVRDAVRTELKTFAMNQLRDELSAMAKSLREGVHTDKQQVHQVFEVQQSSRLQLAPLCKQPMLPGTIEETSPPPPEFPFSTPQHRGHKGLTHAPEEREPEDLGMEGMEGPLVMEQPSRAPDAWTASSASKLGHSKTRVLNSHQDGGNKPSARRTSVNTMSKWSKSSAQFQALLVVSHNSFDVAVAAMILLNGAIVGAQTDYMSQSQTDEQPVAYQVLEIIFCIVFTLELAIRLYAFRCKFFTIPGARAWNIFDLLVVTMQLFEVFMTVVSDGIGISFNLLRTLRLIRVIRMVRTLRLIGELRTIVSSIAGSMKPLFWTAILLFMIVYVLGVYVTQVVSNKRITMIEENKPFPPALDMYWGRLIKSIFSLFQSITNGIDWDTVTRPLIDHIGPELGILYTAYIAFTTLAMLNVVTGVFIQAVIKNATAETEKTKKIHMQVLFKALDVQNVGEICWDSFQSQLNRKEMREFFKTIDVDISQARELFDLLDVDASNTVNAEEFVDGCLRIWSPSTGFDRLLILKDVNDIRTLVEHALDKGLESAGRGNGQQPSIDSQTGLS